MLRKSSQLSSTSMDQAVEIVSLVTSPNSPNSKTKCFQLNQSELESILRKAGRRKIAVLSIVGPFGTGKSFLLCFMLRYLQSLECSNQDQDQDQDQNWILGGSDNPKLVGFPFSDCSEQATTQGISMWSRPFILQSDTQEEIAFFLVDTRGIYEKQTGIREWSALISTSLFMSSATIFNVSCRLQDDSLSILDTFLQHSRLVTDHDHDHDLSKEQEGNSDTIRDTSLTFLIRDWNNPSQFKYGVDGGEKFLNQFLNIDPKMTEEAKKVRENLGSFFAHMNCCLLPHPSDSISDIEYNEPLDQESLVPLFAEQLKSFIETILSSSQIRPKYFTFGPNMTLLASPDNFVSCLNNFIQMFNKNILQSSDQSLPRAAARIHNETLVFNALNYYQHFVQNSVNSKPNPKLSHLHKLHEQLKPFLLSTVQKKLQPSVQRDDVNYHQDLDNQIEVMYRKIKDELIQKRSSIAEQIVTQIIQQVNESLLNLTLPQRLNPILFEKVWTQIDSESIKMFRERTTKMGNSFYEEFVPFVKSQLNQVHERALQNNFLEQEKITTSNEQCLSDAVDLYRDRMTLLIESQQNEEGESFITEQKLQNGHQLSFKSSLDYFKRRSTIPIEANQLLEQSQLRLKNAVEQIYNEISQENSKAGGRIQKQIVTSIEQTFEFYCQQLETEMRGFQKSHSTMLEKLPHAHSFLKVNARDQFQELMELIVDRKMIREGQADLMKKIDDFYQNTFESVQKRVMEEELENSKLCKAYFEKFKSDIATALKGSNSDTVVCMQPESLFKILGEIKAQVLGKVKHDSGLWSRLTNEIEEAIKIIQQQNEVLLAMESSTVDQSLTSALRHFKQMMEGQVPKSKQKFVKLQNEAQGKSMKMVASSAMPQFLIDETKSKLLSEIEVHKEKQLLLFKAERARFKLKERQRLNQLEEKAKRKFEKRLQEFIQNFDIISESDFDQNLKLISNSVLSSFEFELGSLDDDEDSNESEDEEKISVANFKNRLKRIGDTLWKQQIKQNETERETIRRRMKDSIEKYQHQLAVTQNEESPEMFTSFFNTEDGILEDFSNSFRVSDPTVKEGLLKEMRKEISRLQEIQRDKMVASQKDRNERAELERKQIEMDKSKAEEAQLRREMEEQRWRAERQEKDRVAAEILRQKKEKEEHELEEKISKLHSGLKEDSERRQLAEPKKKVVQELSVLIPEVTARYHQKMMTHFRTPVYFDMRTLNDLHGRASKEAIDQIPIDSYNSSDKPQIYSALAEAFKEFERNNQMNAPTSIGIGIDLGTTYSCVGVYINGQVEIIPNGLGNKTTPSYVSFNGQDENDDSVIVGDEAKDQAHASPEKTIYEVKRLIGRRFDDPAIQGDISKWPFKVIQERGIPKVLIGSKRTYHPEEISSMILVHLKKVAESYLKQKVERAVVTVPAYFTEGQRSATKKAGEAAGLEILRIINEPTAAAISYNLGWGSSGSRSNNSNVGGRKGLVFDLGGGTFDVAVFSANQGQIEILKVGGDTHLGGVDFDNEIVNFCVREFEREHKINLTQGRDSSDQKTRSAVSRKLMRLKGICERQKKTLSTESQTIIAMDRIHNEFDLRVKLTRSQFETLITPLVKKSISCVENVLINEAKLKKSDIDEVVLVGGSTRIPFIRKSLSDYFNGKKLNTEVDPDEAVAIGAAYEAAVLNGARAQASGDLRSAAIAPKGMSISDVTPMSLGIEVEGGKMFVLIPRQSKVPTEASSTYTTSYNNQTSVEIVIFEGEDPLAKNNTMVGEFYLNGIPSGLAGQKSVKVTMKVSSEGMILVTATCVENGVEKQLTVRANKRQMTDKDIANIRKKI